MTIDDDNSIYVGGLPYDSTEDMVRRAFDLYGAVVAVKIVNDREVGGKCYGFVTFANPRSAVDAINDMDGRTIGGRTVRVNEVRSRGGRMFNRDFERDMDWDRDRDRDRGRDRDHNRDRYRDRNSDRTRDRGRDREREREQEHGRDNDRLRDRVDRDREKGHDQDRNQNQDRSWDRGSDLNLDRDREISRSKDHDRIRGKDKEQRSKNQLSPHFTESQSREFSSNSSGEYRDQVKEQIEVTFQRRDKLQNEIAQIEEKFEEKQQLVSDLQKKSQKLEESLATAKAVSSQRLAQLTKLQRCYMQVKDNTEKLKTCEKELQLLVDVALVENGEGENVGVRGATQYANGMA